jgi:hypothetical protein
MSKVIYLEKNDIHATLCTWLYCHFWMMWAAEQLGFVSYINWFEGSGSLQSYQDKEMFNKIPNMYDWYFEQPRLLPRFKSDSPYPLPLGNEVWTWENWKDPSPIPLMAQPLSVIKDYYKKYLHFNDATNGRGQTIVDKYGIDFNKTIGITWRGTDIYLDGRPRIAIETYFPFIDEILEKESDLRIMATAEETSILNPLFKRYKNVFSIDEFISSPYMSKHNPERLSNVSGYEKGLQPALMVWLFSKCAHYIKNRSSTGAVASWLSDGRIVSIGHPENLGFPANTDTAEIEGKLYPLTIKN